MNLFGKKQILVAASLLTAATAVPAMALENEFHGGYKVKATTSNYEDGNPGYLAPSKNPRSQNFVEQRGRLMYIAKVDNELKLVTDFEIDSRFGDNSYNGNGTTRNNGGAVGADQVNIETKSVYLDYTINDAPVPINVKVGMQPFRDAYKGIIFANDGAGLVVTSKMNKFNTRLGIFRFYDNLTANLAPAGQPQGKATQDFVNLDGGYQVSDNLKVGASYMFLYDDRSKTTAPENVTVHMLGLNAAGKVNSFNLDAFFILQTGRAGATVDASVVGSAGAPQPYRSVNAFAASVGASAPVGTTGKARLNTIYVSGDDNVNGSGPRKDFITVRGTEQNNYSSNMMILLRHKDAINSDRAIIYNFNNRNQGVIGGLLGYDHSVGKFFMNSNIGFAAVAKNTSKNKSDYIGTEINTEIGYKLKPNLTTSIQGAYVALGDYWLGANGAHATNPYTSRVVVNYTF